ncbi:MAG: flagellar export protein FliJ, partial [Candidatus Hydrogenedentota bacterium]
MKAYKFRFEKVLKSKKIIVDELASKNARAQKILTLEVRRLDDLKEREARCVRELVLRQVGRVNAGELQQGHSYLQLLGSAIVQQVTRVREIARRVETLRNMLVEAEKERKIFEKLDEREREAFHRSFLKKEQALLDEVGINRFVRR